MCLARLRAAPTSPCRHTGQSAAEEQERPRLGHHGNGPSVEHHSIDLGIGIDTARRAGLAFPCALSPHSNPVPEDS